MAVDIVEKKQIQLTINKLTKEQYEDIDAILLSTELSDQLFMTTDDAGEDKGNADIVYMSPEEYAEMSEAGLIDEEKYYATSAVGGQIDPTSLSNYAVLSGGNAISGSNVISVLNVEKLSAANDLRTDDTLNGKSLVMTNEDSSYNVDFDILKTQVQPDLSQYALSSQIPLSVSQLENDTGFVAATNVIAFPDYSSTRQELSALPYRAQSNGLIFMNAYMNDRDWRIEVNGKTIYYDLADHHISYITISLIVSAGDLIDFHAEPTEYKIYFTPFKKL